MKHCILPVSICVLLTLSLPIFSLQAELSLGAGHTTHSDQTLAHTSGYEADDKQETADSITLTYKDENGREVSGTFTPSLDENGTPCYSLEGGVKAGAEASKKIYAKQAKDGSWGVSFDGKAYANIGATAKVDSSEASVQVGGEAGVSVDGDASGRLGSDQYNVHGNAHATLDAKAKAVAVAALMYDKEYGAKVAAEIGTALSANGTLTGGFTLAGIPVDVELYGAAEIGAKAVAEGQITFNKETGKFEIYTKLGAAAGIGLEGGVKVSIGVGQLIAFISQSGGKLADELGKWLDGVMDILDGHQNNPFADDPDGGSQDDSEKGFKGLQPIKLHR